MADYDDREVDNQAFNNMQRSTERAPDRLFEKGRMFTESEYNTRATTAERIEYDSIAYSILMDLYSEDRKKDRFQTFNFSQYLKNVDSDYLEEKFLHARTDDPEFYKEAGTLLRDIYGGDSEQLKLSAYNVSAQMVPRGPGDDVIKRDRSNVSIKAPGAERY
jgi:hypothetical protein|tara:strand:- start:71 stop:556 length:486 start_codon:yes stop_codon:yes gene_type:complete